MGQHWAKDTEAMRGNGWRDDSGRSYVRWCFANLITAQDFARKFGGSSEGAIECPQKPGIKYRIAKLTCDDADQIAAVAQRTTSSGWPTTQARTPSIRSA